MFKKPNLKAALLLILVVISIFSLGYYTESPTGMAKITGNVVGVTGMAVDSTTQQKSQLVPEEETFSPNRTAATWIIVSIIILILISLIILIIKKKAKTALPKILTIIALIILVVIAGFWYSGRKTAEITKEVKTPETVEKTPIEEAKELSINNLVFASYIDDDYNYEVRENSIYSIGEDVYVYFEVSGFGRVDEEFEKKVETEWPGLDVQIGETSIMRDFEVMDPMGRIVIDLTENDIIFGEVIDKNINRIKAKHILMLGKGLIPGVYTINIDVSDGILERSVKKKIQFEIR